MPPEQDSTPPLGDPKGEQRTPGSRSSRLPPPPPLRSSARLRDRSARTSHSSISTQEERDGKRSPRQVRRIKLVRRNSQPISSDDQHIASSSQSHQEKGQNESSPILSPEPLQENEQYGSPDASSPRSQQQKDQDASPATSSSERSNYSNMTMKIYRDNRIYSIFDRSTKEYIYHAEKDAGKGYFITYHEGVCIRIQDSYHNVVYVSPKYEPPPWTTAQWQEWQLQRLYDSTAPRRPVVN